MNVKIFTDYDSIKVEDFLEGMYIHHIVSEVKFSTSVCTITQKAFYSILVIYQDKEFDDEK